MPFTEWLIIKLIGQMKWNDFERLSSKSNLWSQVIDNYFFWKLYKGDYASMRDFYVSIETCSTENRIGMIQVWLKHHTFKELCEYICTFFEKSARREPKNWIGLRK